MLYKIKGKVKINVLRKKRLVKLTDERIVNILYLLNTKVRTLAN